MASERPGRRAARPRPAILILHGAQDMTFPVQLAQRLHKAVPTSKLEIIEQAGHMAQFEQPDRWSKAVDEFLSD
jgi:pimeloyl-ACP methyl ester carboxylesterase